MTGADPTEASDDGPLSQHRLSTPLRPGIPAVGLLVHAFNCVDTACTLPNCFQTKGMVTSLIDHNAKCPKRRHVDPKKPPPDRNTCKPCRLFEALQRTRRRRDLQRRSTAAIQKATVCPTTQSWQTALQSQNPREIKRALQEHVNLCSNPTACTICKRIRDHCRRGSNANFPPGLFADLNPSEAVPPANLGPGKTLAYDLSMTAHHPTATLSPPPLPRPQAPTTRVT